MLYLQIASPKSSVLNFLDSNSFEVIISIFQRTEKVPDMERLRDVIGFDIDELGDETSTVGGFQIIHVPIYAEYTECGLCGFTYNDFIEIE